MADTETECQKIILATAQGLQFCGAPVHRGSYCAEHYPRIFTKHSAYIPAAYRLSDSTGGVDGPAL